jgi:hypothetical protein
MSDVSLTVLGNDNCGIGGCAAKNIHTTCPSCVHWTPSAGSKYYSCQQWYQSRVTCDLPRSACPTCDHHIKPGSIGPGRPVTVGVNWKDPEEVREYNREAKRRSRFKKRGDHSAG